MEAKNQNVPYGPNQMVHEFVGYHGVSDDLAESISVRQAQPPHKAFIGKLLDNVDQVARQKEAVLRLLGLHVDDPSSWRIIPLIVTSRPTPAAAVTKPRVTFATVPALCALLDPKHDSAERSMRAA